MGLASVVRDEFGDGLRVVVVGLRMAALLLETKFASAFHRRVVVARLTATPLGVT